MESVVRKLNKGDNDYKRDIAKELFIILGYGGAIDSWCKEHGVDKNVLPRFAQDFAEEQRALRRQDALMEPNLHKMAKESRHYRPDVKVQAILNLRGEREAMDRMNTGLDESDVCIASFEHDGLFIFLPPWLEEHAPDVSTWKREMVNNASACAGVRLKGKPVPEYDEILKQFKTQFGSDWEGNPIPTSD